MGRKCKYRVRRGDKYKNHGTRRHLASLQMRKATSSQFYPPMMPMNYINDQYGPVILRIKKWHEYLGSNQHLDKRENMPGNEH